MAFINSLTGHTLYAIHCEVENGQVSCGYAIFSESFVNGDHEVWDTRDRRYRVTVDDGKPGKTEFEVRWPIVAL